MSAAATLTDLTIEPGHTIRWKDRYRGHLSLDPHRLLSHPLNAHVHPAAQQLTMQGALDEIGWLDSIKVAVQPWPADTETQDDPTAIWLPTASGIDGGALQVNGAWWKIGPVFNGHMRTILALRHQQPEVPVDFYELTDQEGLYALITYDTIGAQAYMNAANVGAIMEGVRTANAEVQGLIQRVAREAGLTQIPAHLGGTPVAPVAGPSVREVLGSVAGGGSGAVAPAETETEEVVRPPPRSKQLILTFPANEYLPLIKRLTAVGAEHDLDNPSAVVRYLLDYYEETTAETGDRA